jgi:hypothetical protein
MDGCMCIWAKSYDRALGCSGQRACRTRLNSIIETADLVSITVALARRQMHFWPWSCATLSPRGIETRWSRQCHVLSHRHTFSKPLSNTSCTVDRPGECRSPDGLRVWARRGRSISMHVSWSVTSAYASDGPIAGGHAGLAALREDLTRGSTGRLEADMGMAQLNAIAIVGERP